MILSNTQTRIEKTELNSEMPATQSDQSDSPTLQTLLSGPSRKGLLLFIPKRTSSKKCPLMLTQPRILPHQLPRRASAPSHEFGYQSSLKQNNSTQQQSLCYLSRRSSFGFVAAPANETHASAGLHHTFPIGHKLFRQRWTYTAYHEFAPELANEPRGDKEDRTGEQYSERATKSPNLTQKNRKLCCEDKCCHNTDVSELVASV